MVPRIMPTGNDFGSARVNKQAALSNGLTIRPLKESVSDIIRLADFRCRDRRTLQKSRNRPGNRFGQRSRHPRSLGRPKLKNPCISANKKPTEETISSVGFLIIKCNISAVIQTTFTLEAFNPFGPSSTS